MRASVLALFMATAIVTLDAAARELPVEGSLEEVAAQADVVVIGHRGRTVSRGEFGTRVVEIVVDRTLFGADGHSILLSTAQGVLSSGDTLLFLRHPDHSRLAPADALLTPLAVRSHDGQPVVEFDGSIQVPWSIRVVPDPSFTPERYINPARSGFVRISDLSAYLNDVHARLGTDGLLSVPPLAMTLGSGADPELIAHHVACRDAPTPTPIVSFAAPTAPRASDVWESWQWLQVVREPNLCSAPEEQQAVRVTYSGFGIEPVIVRISTDGAQHYLTAKQLPFTDDWRKGRAVQIASRGLRPDEWQHLSDLTAATSAWDLPPIPLGPPVDEITADGRSLSLELRDGDRYHKVTRDAYLPGDFHDLCVYVLTLAGAQTPTTR